MSTNPTPYKPSRLAAVRRASVFRGDQLAGFLERTRSGARFSYDSAFLHANAGKKGIAVHLPLTPRQIEVNGYNLHPFFANLLPEGARLDALLNAAKAPKDDLLTHLVRAGSDTIGDVCVVEEGARPDRTRGPVVDLGKLGAASFAEALATSLDYASAMHDRATIPGVQNKVSASMISFPVRGARRRGEYILKLEPLKLPRILENEQFFMVAAKSCGLDVADVSIIHDKHAASGLLVRRFDRVKERGAKAPTFIHQEDGCQLLERYPADKYAVQMSDIANALGVCRSPVLAVAGLIRLAAFSYVIANGDLHAKNISVYSRAPGVLELTPAYDLLSTLPYGDDRMALSLEGRDTKWKRSHFLAFGDRFGVRSAAVEKILDDVCVGIEPFLSRLNEIGLDAKKTSHLHRTMQRRITDLS